MLHQWTVESTRCADFDATAPAQIRLAHQKLVRLAALGVITDAYVYFRGPDVRFVARTDETAQESLRMDGFDILSPSPVILRTDTADAAIARVFPMLRRAPILPL